MDDVRPELPADIVPMADPKTKKPRTRRPENCQYEQCGIPLPEKRNRNKKYCNDACRKAQARLRSGHALSANPEDRGLEIGTNTGQNQAQAAKKEGSKMEYIVTQTDDWDGYDAIYEATANGRAVYRADMTETIAHVRSIMRPGDTWLNTNSGKLTTYDEVVDGNKVRELAAERGNNDPEVVAMFDRLKSKYWGGAS